MKEGQRWNMKNPKREKTSARLRASERVAELVGFKYDTERYQYGGFFTTYELEMIIKELEKGKNG